MVELDEGWLIDGELKEDGLNEMKNIASRQEGQENLHDIERDEQHGV